MMHLITKKPLNFAILLIPKKKNEREKGKGKIKPEFPLFH